MSNEDELSGLQAGPMPCCHLAPFAAYVLLEHAANYSSYRSAVFALQLADFQMAQVLPALKIIDTGPFQCANQVV